MGLWLNATTKTYKTSESDRPPPPQKAILSILNPVVVLQKCHDFVVGSYSRVILKAIPLRYPFCHPKSWAKAAVQVEGSKFRIWISD